MDSLFFDGKTALMCGDSSTYVGNSDLIITNPYADLPEQLKTKPMFICDMSDRHALAEKRCGTKLYKVSEWYDGKNTIWAGNMDVSKLPPIDLTDLVPLAEGYFPLELPLRLLDAYEHIDRNFRWVWDGFMGRGTVGLACRLLGYNFMGIDKDEARVKYSVRYVNAINYRGREQLVP